MPEERCRLILGDCLEKLKELPDESVDLIITDPPYHVLKMQSWDMQWQTTEDYIQWTKKWLEECYRIAKNNIAMYVFFGQKMMKDLLNLETQWQFKRMLIWHHPNLAKPTRNMYLWTYDPIFYFVKGNPKFDASFVGSENVDVFTFPKPQSNFDEEQRFHPASKPIGLIKKLILPTTKPNDLILDPFMGCGTTGVAAILLNRRFVGIEKDNTYFDDANRRIEGYLQQKKLTLIQNISL